MRSVDLAIYADALAGEASALAARLERARGRVRQAAIEREARRSLGPATAGCLEARGIFGGVDETYERQEIADLSGALAALEALQAWVERRLESVREEGYAMTE
jgi:hypothetical protein